MLRDIVSGGAIFQGRCVEDQGVEDQGLDADVRMRICMLCM